MTLFIPSMMRRCSRSGHNRMEILRQHMPDHRCHFIPVGGGGLIAGIGAYVKFVFPQVKIIGVEPEDAPTLQRLLQPTAGWCLNKLESSLTVLRSDRSERRV